jgi:hypothetical protein
VGVDIEPDIHVIFYPLLPPEILPNRNVDKEKKYDTCKKCILHEKRFC